jgi:hypothetical protein
MPTVAEQTTILGNYLASGRYPEAYNYIASQISGDPAWNQKLAAWFNDAASINGGSSPRSSSNRIRLSRSGGGRRRS